MRDIFYLNIKAIDLINGLCPCHSYSVVVSSALYWEGRSADQNFFLSHLIVINNTSAKLSIESPFEHTFLANSHLYKVNTPLLSLHHVHPQPNRPRNPFPRRHLRLIPASNPPRRILTSQSRRTLRPPLPPTAARNSGVSRGDLGIEKPTRAVRL